MISVVSLVAGLLVGVAGSAVLAAMEPPTEHKGLTVALLGEIPETSLQRQIGLGGYVLRLREVTIDAGGQIARHSHATRPGLVYTLAGTVIEGRPAGENAYSAGTTFLEDADTEHWVWNRGSEPARILVCDINPPS